MKPTGKTTKTLKTAEITARMSGLCVVFYRRKLFKISLLGSTKLSGRKMKSEIAWPGSVKKVGNSKRPSRQRWQIAGIYINIPYNKQEQIFYLKKIPKSLRKIPGRAGFSTRRGNPGSGPVSGFENFPGRVLNFLSGFRISF